MSKSHFSNQFFHPIPKEKLPGEAPRRFTFPFYYSPHPWAEWAANDLQAYLSQAKLDHNFGLDTEKEGLVIGKMFGVLVVNDSKGNIGYLAAFSGKLADANHHPGFVPPVFDMLESHGFFKQEEQVLNRLNAEIEVLEQDPEGKRLHQSWQDTIVKFNREIEDLKALHRLRKKSRKKLRNLAEKELHPQWLEAFKDVLTQESLSDNYHFRDLNRRAKKAIEAAEYAFRQWEKPLNEKKRLRKEGSNALQQKLFESYTFLDALGEEKSLRGIFKNMVPPAGAGECAAPKLLQYAYQHGYSPLCMAEFWWGESPKSEVRKHGDFYPACRGKCEPILGHMLQGLAIDPNPLLDQLATVEELELLYEDEHLVVVNKPEEFLSVPGKSITDSVHTRMAAKYPQATGPLLVHRLDMSTSGILLVAKSSGIHKKLQAQFIQRQVRKTYLAVLDGEVEKSEGKIHLPLRVDLDNRPHQLVCYTHGKPALTHYKVLDKSNGKTRIAFEPHTGRTHQLRVHAAHQEGLNCPILGDDLYGKPSNRLHLHAWKLEFTHPITKEAMKMESPAPF